MFGFKKYFRYKNRQKMAFLTQNTKLCKKLIITLVFEEKANFAHFFAENWRKSQEIVIITSIPGRPWLRVDLVFHAEKRPPVTL
jgi:hypothetical protein